MIKRKFFKSYMIFLLLFLISPITKEKIMAVEKEDELNNVVKDYMRNLPFIEIGPDWGEDHIVIEEIYDKCRKEREEICVR